VTALILGYAREHGRASGSVRDRGAVSRGGMATLRSGSLHGPLDDDVLARRLGVSQRQQINQTARRLERR